jgi:hypothetical protein
VITVRQLIEILQKQDPEALVCTEARDETWDVREEWIKVGFVEIVSHWLRTDDLYVDNFTEDREHLAELDKGRQQSRQKEIRKAVCL